MHSHDTVGNRQAEARTAGRAPERLEEVIEDLLRETVAVIAHTSSDPELADLGGAGSLVSTTDDLLKWQEALFGGKLLTPASFTKMTTPFRNGYGCALRLALSASGRHVFANDGRVPGWNAALQYYAEDKLVIAVLANLDTQVDALIARDLARAALGVQ